MSKINLTELPTIQSVDHKPVSFRGSTSSTQYNTFNEDTYFDITNLYSVINEMTNSFQEMSMAHSIDSAYTQMRIGDMPFIIEQLQNEIEGYKYGIHRKAIIYPSKITNSTEDKADINIQYGQVNIPAYAVSSKLYIYDESLDLITIPSTLISKVTPESDGTTTIDNDFKNCIKDSENEYFIRKVYSDATDPVDMQIEVTLPDNIISNRNVNTIYLSPYPFAALDILNVEYQAETDWKPLPGLSSHKQYKDGAIRNAENIKLCFNKVQISKIRITLRQQTYIVEGERNVFYLGLKHLAVNYEAVDKKFCTFIADVNFNSTKKKTVFNITPKLNNNNILSDTTNDKRALFSFELYSVNDVGEKRHIKDTMPFTFTDERLMIVTNMYYDSTNDINPSLYKLEIEYDVDGDGSGGAQQEPGDITTSDSDCKCILSDMVFYGDNIIIGADENSKPYQLSAATILDGDCSIQNHVDKNIIYTYTIKDYGAGARISGDTLVVNSAGVVTITATARLGKAIISKDAIFTVDKIKKYTLTYLSTTGGTIEGKKIQNIELGNDASPVKAVQDVGYHFMQWSDATVTLDRHDTNITSSAIYTAQFEINQYPVIYLDKEGREFYREMVKHGFPAIPPTAPILDDYLFTGWDKPLDSITEPVTVQAQYRIKTFIVRFLDWDDRLISTREIVIHKDAQLPETPTKEGYDFTGWSQSTSAVTSDITAKAQFKIKTFVITFLNWDGSELSKQTIEWMKDAKAPSVYREGWHFVGWSDVYTRVIKDITVTAQFEINVYQVKFLDWDGAVLKADSIPHGSEAIAPDVPQKTGYDFTGWDTKFTSITKNTTISATFKIKVFKVSAIVVGDGAYTLSSASVEYGSPVTITTSANVTSNFKSITLNNKEVSLTGNKYTVSQVTEDIEFNILFEIKTFTVRWYVFGELIKSEIVNYGTDVTTVHPIISKEGYDFTGWTTSSSSKDTNIVSNTTFIGELSVKRFVITPSALSPSDAGYSQGTISPDAPQTVSWNSSKTFYFSPYLGLELYSLKIDGKDTPYTSTSYTFYNIQDNHSIEAQYRWKTYTVTFNNWDGSTLKTETVKYGKSATAPSVPAKEGHVFSGWNGSFEKITGNTTVTAKFTANKYTVTYNNWDGTLIGTRLIEHGKSGETGYTPAKKWCRFTGWLPNVSSVKSNMTVTAQYEDVLVGPITIKQAQSPAAVVYSNSNLNRAPYTMTDAKFISSTLKCIESGYSSSNTGEYYSGKDLLPLYKFYVNGTELTAAQMRELEITFSTTNLQNRIESHYFAGVEQSYMYIGKNNALSLKDYNQANISGTMTVKYYNQTYTTTISCNNGDLGIVVRNINDSSTPTSFSSSTSWTSSGAGAEWTLYSYRLQTDASDPTKRQNYMVLTPIMGYNYMKSTSSLIQSYGVYSRSSTGSIKPKYYNTSPTSAGGETTSTFDVYSDKNISATSGYDDMSSLISYTIDYVLIDGTRITGYIDRR